jgi:cytochrome c oxidase cbb3-type subunit 3
MAKYQENPMENHEADGIKEFDNNLPRWWLYGFYFTIIFSIGYMVQYHMTGNGDVMRQEYAQEMAEAKVKYKIAENTGSMKGLVVKNDPATIEAGKKLFVGANLCYTCHREDGGGLVGPNLTDDYWIHGNSPDSLAASIVNGFPDKGMLPYGNTTKMSDEEVMQVVSYIMSLRGTNPPNPKPIDPEREKLMSSTGSTM